MKSTRKVDLHILQEKSFIMTIHLVILLTRSNLFRPILFRTLQHPAFSPDVSTPDFGLFGTVKQKLIGIVHEDKESLQDLINEIVSSFDIEFWQSIFQSWIKRLEKLIEVDGDYLE